MANLADSGQATALVIFCTAETTRWLSWMRRPTGDQEVAGSTPAEVGNIISWRLIMKYFLRSFSPFADSRRAVVSFWRKNVHNTGKPLRGLSLPSKRVVR